MEARLITSDDEITTNDPDPKSPKSVNNNPETNAIGTTTMIRLESENNSVQAPVTDAVVLPSTSLAANCALINENEQDTVSSSNRSNTATNRESLARNDSKNSDLDKHKNIMALLDRLNSVLLLVIVPLSLIMCKKICFNII